MSQDSVEAEITKTAATAKKLLFDSKGAAKGNQHYIPLLTLNTVCKPLSQFKSGIGDLHFRWRNARFAYDPSAANIFLASARAGDYYSDGVACGAAALLLAATGGIADKRLRAYAAERLSGDVPPPAESTKDRNIYRDSVIASYLIRPLVLRRFRPTRNEATKDADKGESACSIVSQALDRIGLNLSERRLSEIWTDAVRRAPNLTKN
jgi:hypothetical protein